MKLADPGFALLAEGGGLKKTLIKVEESYQVIVTLKSESVRPSLDAVLVPSNVDYIIELPNIEPPQNAAIILMALIVRGEPQCHPG